MLHIPTHKQAKREQLDNDIAAFLKKGGKIIEVISNEDRKKKEDLIKRHLFFSAHHNFHSKNTGFSVARLREIQRTPGHAGDEEIEALWVYFRSREINTYLVEAL